MRDNQVVIVVGETGSGKTTQLTQVRKNVNRSTRKQRRCEVLNEFMSAVPRQIRLPLSSLWLHSEVMLLSVFVVVAASITYSCAAILHFFSSSTCMRTDTQIME